jgi:hypothetical protein
MRGLPIFTFCNKMDRPSLSGFDIIDQLDKEFGLAAYPITWPIGSGGCPWLEEGGGVRGWAWEEVAPAHPCTWPIGAGGCPGWRLGDSRALCRQLGHVAGSKPRGGQQAAPPRWDQAPAAVAA